MLEMDDINELTFKLRADIGQLFIYPFDLSFLAFTCEGDRGQYVEKNWQFQKKSKGF